MPSKIAVLKLKIEVYIANLRKAPERTLGQNATISSAEQLNGFLEEAEALLPDLAKDLPRAVDTLGFLSEAGRVSASYLDLAGIAEQALAVVDLSEEA